MCAIVLTMSSCCVGDDFYDVWLLLHWFSTVQTPFRTRVVLVVLLCIFFCFVLDFWMLCCVHFLLCLATVVNDLHGRIFLVLFLLCIVLLNLVHVLFWCCVFFEFVLCFYVFPPCFGLVLWFRFLRIFNHVVAMTSLTVFSACFVVPVCSASALGH